MGNFDLTEKLKEELKKRNLWEQDEDDEDEDEEDDEEDDNEESSNENDLDDDDGVKLYKLSDKVVKLLTARLKDEYTAHYFYRAAANWCNDVNYKKAATYFENEAVDELTHAQKIQDYMTGFNIIPQIPIANPKHNFNNLINIVNDAYTIELNLMNAYNKVSHIVFREDITTFDFLTDLREIQKNSVVEYNDLINASNLVDKEDKFQVLYFEQTYF
jgi:ferritin